MLKTRRFRQRVEQITFAGRQAAQQGRRVLYVTERCVFELTPRGLVLDPDLSRRIHYDAAQDTLFLNFQHLQVRDATGIDAIRAAVSAQCEAIGRRVDAVINYDGFQIAPGLEDAYAAMAREMQERYYGNVTRYASGAFRRMKVVRSLEG